jgi:nitrogen fixation NifU-like protein
MIDPGLRDLYQEVILDHNRSPRNYRAIDGGRSAEGYNPLCGDRVTVYLAMAGDRIADAAFQGQGCAISKAAASMMTEAVKGRTRAEAAAIFDRYRRLVTSRPDAPAATEGLGKLAVFAGVREFPMRVKCATLAWHTLAAAVEGKDAPVTTE